MNAEGSKFPRVHAAGSHLLPARRRLTLKKSIAKLFNSIADIKSERCANDPHTENLLRSNLHSFFNDTGYLLSEDNFRQLLNEKSDDKFYRNDGTVGWYHEGVPVMMALALVRLGKKSGGIDGHDLVPYGGLDVLIGTHLRHDSVEDHVHKDILRRQMANGFKASNQNADDSAQCRTYKKISMIVQNVDLMSQKKLFDEDGNPVLDERGKHKKEDVRVFTHRMVDPDTSNPIVFMCKQMDVIHNLSTMFCAPKFNAELRKKRCNEREDMYGGRYGFADIAKQQWPEFKNAINTLDCMMGFLLYAHFRYLESVDLAYPDKQPNDYPVGIGRYLKRALSLNLPEGFHPVHVFMKRMMASVDPDQEPEKFGRLQNFMDKVIKPALIGYEDRFPYLFNGPKPENIPAPVAM